MKRLLVLTIAALAVVFVATSAVAQAPTMGSALGEFQACFCTTTTSGEATCVLDGPCPPTSDCPNGTDAECPVGSVCLLETCCGIGPVCSIGPCPDGEDCINPGVCGTFEACEHPPVPTLTQWGLIALAFLLLTGVAYLVIRRRSMPMVVVMLVLALAVSGWAYHSIVNTPTCEDLPQDEIAYLGLE